MYASPMTTTIAEKPADLAAVRRLSNPREKLRQAAALIQDGARAMEPHRLRRNSAAILIFRQANAKEMAAGLSPAMWPMQPAAMWRDTIDISRSLWHKIMDEANPEKIVQLRAELAELDAEIAGLDTERAAELPQLHRERDKITRAVARRQAQVDAITALQAEIDADPQVGKALLGIARDEAEIVHRFEMQAEEAMRLRDQLAIELINGGHGAPAANAEVARLAKLSTARVAQLRNTRFVG